jgi:hypothetical protein
MNNKKPPHKTIKKTKTASKNASKAGKAAVEKGRKFEEIVADLYRLLGAEVTPNIEIQFKKVDILAEFPIPGSGQKYRVIVECKDEKKAVNANQRVDSFSGLLNRARIAGDADSAEIITRVPWSDQAKGAARASGISLLTYHQKLSQLIDFKPYLKEVVNRFEKKDTLRPNDPPLSAYYVDISGEMNIGGKTENLPIVTTYIKEWLKAKDKKNQLAVFGGYGTGKSSLCFKLMYDLSKDYLVNSEENRIPILLNLRDFVGKIKIEAFITSFLDQECNVSNPKFNLFREMNDAGIFLLIFDGLDEMAVKVDSDVLEANLMEIDKLAASPNSKILLTSRPEHFISEIEEQQVLQPELNVFGNRAAKYEPLKILPWIEPQINSFLEKRVPLIKGVNEPWTVYRDRINSIQELKDLSHRPVLLEMIVKTLPKLIESGITINLNNLYKTYLSEEIKRQKIAKKRELLLTEKSRFRILETLAIDNYCWLCTKTSFCTKSA